MPIFALAVGVTLMDESVSAADCVGLMLVLAGIGIGRRDAERLAPKTG